MKKIYLCTAIAMAVAGVMGFFGAYVLFGSLYFSIYATFLMGIPGGIASLLVNRKDNFLVSAMLGFTFGLPAIIAASL